MKDISDADFKDRVCKNFSIKNLGEYYNLYFQNDTLLFAYVFNNF